MKYAALVLGALIAIPATAYTVFWIYVVFRMLQFCDWSAAVCANLGPAGI